MKGRGRPKVADILTPREWQVLELIRRGLSNREIADALGISLAGAKFHVSEIISKLGVESREEAAAWQPESRRWSFLPSLAAVPGLRHVVPTLAPKIAAAVLASTAVAGIGVAGLMLSDSAIGPRGNSSTVATKATPTPPPSCIPPLCERFTPRGFTTLAEAAAVASFEPRLPAYIPERFKPHAITHTRIAREPINRASHNDFINVYYRDAAGHAIHIAQGFPAMPLLVQPGVPVWDWAPPEKRGTVMIGDEVAYWTAAARHFARAPVPGKR